MSSWIKTSFAARMQAVFPPPDFFPRGWKMSLENLFLNNYRNPLIVRTEFFDLTKSINGMILLSQLAYLTNKYGLNFYMKDCYLMQRTRLSKFQLKSAKRDLKKLEFLKITYVGMPKKTHYSVNPKIWMAEMKKLESELRKKDRSGRPKGPVQWVQNSLTRGCKTDRNETIYNKTNNNNTVRRKTADGYIEKREIHPRWIKLANQLSNAVRSIKNIRTNPNGWALSISKIKDAKNEVPIQRIKKAMNWYCEHIGEKYIPDIQSGESFKKKFVQLEAAMARAGETPAAAPARSQAQVKCTESEKRSVGETLEIFQQYNIRLTTLEIYNTLKSIWDWKKTNRPIFFKLMDGLKEIKQKDGTYLSGGHRWDLGKDAEDMLEKFYNSLFDQYWNWAAKQIKGWPEWGGTLEKFKPGGLHFVRWFHLVMGRGRCSEIERMVKCEKAGN